LLVATRTLERDNELKAQDTRRTRHTAKAERGLSTTLSLPPLSGERETPVACLACGLDSSIYEPRCRRCSAELPTNPTVAWRKGKHVVFRSGATLPKRCVRCNATTHGDPIKRKLYWHHPALYLFVFLWVIGYIIVALAVRKRADVTFHVCEAHQRQRRTAMVGGSTTMVVGGVLFFGSIGAESLPFLIASGVVLLGGAIWTWWGRRLASVRKIDREFVYAGGVGTDFAASLPAWTQ
jgi:hypothetical protein